MKHHSNSIHKNMENDITCMINVLKANILVEYDERGFQQTVSITMVTISRMRRVHSETPL